jgi:GTPase
MCTVPPRPTDPNSTADASGTTAISTAMNSTPEQTSSRCGMIAIVGRPNVGKSTLMNALVGQKVSITSRKAQTTRHRITGIRTLDGAQFIFVDTPGFQTRHGSALNRSLNRAVTSTLSSVDVVLFVVEAGRFGPDDQKVLDLIPPSVPTLLVANKIDRVADKDTLLPFLQKTASLRTFQESVPMTAKHPDDIERLFEILRPYLPEGEPIYGEDDLTDRSERFLAAEILREKVFRWTGDELPYTSTVLIDKFEQEGNLRRIFATILVDRDSHKAMIIGQKGAKLKQISTEARLDMEKLFDGPVYLETFIKVKSGWADNEAGLRAYGYE